MTYAPLLPSLVKKRVQQPRIKGQRAAVHTKTQSDSPQTISTIPPSSAPAATGPRSSTVPTAKKQSSKVPSRDQSDSQNISNISSDSNASWFTLCNLSIVGALCGIGVIIYKMRIGTSRNDRKQEAVKLTSRFLEGAMATYKICLI